MTCGCKKDAGSVDLSKSIDFGPFSFKECGCGCGGGRALEKFLISVLSAVLFFIVAHPQTFLLVRGLVGDWVSNATGCPTILGLLLHSIVFFFLVWGLMKIKKYKK
jgi:hypothetical protein